MDAERSRASEGFKKNISPKIGRTWVALRLNIQIYKCQTQINKPLSCFLGAGLILVAICHFFGVPPQGNRHWFMNMGLTLEFLGLFSKFHAGDGFENVPWWIGWLATCEADCGRSLEAAHHRELQGARGARHISLEIVRSHHLRGFGGSKGGKAQKEAKHRLRTYAVHMLLKNSEAM